MAHLVGELFGAQNSMSSSSSRSSLTYFRLLKLRRLRALTYNHGLITAFATMCCFVVMVTFLETSRALIPTKIVTKDELQTLTEGFSNDIPVPEVTSYKRYASSSLAPHPHRPRVMVVGFSHCGGHVLMSTLAAHPDLAVNRKAVKYFSDSLSLRKYIAHMPPSLDHHVTVDGSFTYVTNKTALKRIKNFNDTMKIIVIVCDPISRLLANHTDYLHRQKELLTGQKLIPDRNIDWDLNSLKERIYTKSNRQFRLNSDHVTDIGDYFKYSIDLFTVFSRKQVHFIEKNRFYQNPIDEMNKVHEFIGVTPHAEAEGVEYDVASGSMCYEYVYGKRTCVKDMHNANHTRRLLARDPELLDTLSKVYKPFNKRFSLYLEDDFDWL